MSTLIFNNASEAYDNYPKGKVPRLDVSFQVTDILQLVAHSGRKLALVSMTSGFAWFRLDDVTDAVPDIWTSYVAWYFSEFGVHPLSLLEDDVPSPTRSASAREVRTPDGSPTEWAQRLPASPYESADIPVIFSAAILSKNLSVLRPDWLAFLGDPEYALFQQEFEEKVYLIPYWQRFKSLCAFMHLKVFVSASKQRAITRGWLLWQEQTKMAVSMSSV